jgi:effector-binding domain-containing protein
MHTEWRTVPEQQTAVLRATLRHNEVHAWFRTTFDIVAEYLRRHDIAACGFPFARYHLRLDGAFEVEAGFPVAVRVTGNSLIRPSSLPAGPVIVAWHVGGYEQLGDAYKAVDDWLKDHHGTRAGDSWEIYHGSDYRRHDRTEVVQPFTVQQTGQSLSRAGRC